MQPVDDIAVPVAAPSDLDVLLAFVDEDSADENGADGGARRRTRDLVLGLLSIPVLFVGLVTAIVWIVPVVATSLPIVLDYIALSNAR